MYVTDVRHLANWHNKTSTAQLEVTNISKAMKMEHLPACTQNDATVRARVPMALAPTRSLDDLSTALFSRGLFFSA